MSLSTFAKNVSISRKELLGACLVSFFILGGASGCSVSVLDPLLSSFSERYIYIKDNKYYLNNIMEKVIPKSKTKFLQNFF